MVACSCFCDSWAGPSMARRGSHHLSGQADCGPLHTPWGPRPAGLTPCGQQVRHARACAHAHGRVAPCVALTWWQVSSRVSLAGDQRDCLCGYFLVACSWSLAEEFATGEERGSRFLSGERAGLWGPLPCLAACSPNSPVRNSAGSGPSVCDPAPPSGGRQSPWRPQGKHGTRQVGAGDSHRVLGVSLGCYGAPETSPPPETQACPESCRHAFPLQEQCGVVCCRLTLSSCIPPVTEFADRVCG